MSHFADPGRPDRTGSGGGDPHLDTGAMALHALPDDEAERFLNHLDGCPSCTLELAGFRETLALVGATDAQAPPARLRSAVLTAVRQVPQLPPLVAGQGRTRHRAPDAPEGAEGAGSRATARAHRVWYRRPATWLTAAAAAIVVAFGAVAVVRSVAPAPDQQVALSECVSSAADARVLDPSDQDGVVRFAPSCGAAVVDVSGLPALPNGRTYQLWVLAGDQARSVTLLDSAAQGRAQQWTAVTRPGDTAIGITDEPAGGSPQPTSTPLWAVALT